MSEIQLEWLDWSVMGLYVVLLLGLGFYFRSFAQQGLENYFLGGRDVSGFMSGVSYSATTLNADVAPAYCGMTVITGVFVYWWYISRFSLALMIGGILFAVFWRRLNIFTSPEFYGFRFQRLCRPSGKHSSDARIQKASGVNLFHLRDLSTTLPSQ
ncbi:MAG: hypothetical protein WEA36_09815 [Balneolaceae bacterium]